MTLQYRAAVLHAAQTPMSIETVTAAEESIAFKLPRELRETPAL